MIIERLNLTHFGAFHQKEIELRPGINIIYGENEAGKTTVHRFIQAMLFGVERLRGRASKRDEYSRFRPWEQGRNYEGTMVIRHEGQSYRLIRSFYKEDEYFRIEQLETGKRLELSGDSIEELIEGLNRSNYRNGLSAGQLESEIDGRFGLSLQAYMANIKRTRSEDVNLEQTLDYLKKEKRKRSDSNRAKEIQTLKEQIGALEVAEEDRMGQQAEIQRRKAELQRFRQEIASGQQSGREKRRKEQQERLEAIRLIEENNRIASLYSEKKAAYETLKQRAAEEDFDEVKARWDEANEAYERISDQYEQLNGRNLAILFSVMMFGLIPLIVLFFLQNGTGIRIGASLLLAAVLAAVWALLQKGRQRMGKRAAESRKELERMQTVMENHLFGRGGRESLRQLKEELKELRKAYEELQAPLAPYLEKYGENVSVDMEEDEADQWFDQLRAKEDQMIRELERRMVEEEAMEERISEQALLQEQLEALMQESEEAREEIELIDECMGMLHELSEEIHSGFSPALNRSVSEMMGSLTGGKYEKIFVDNELNPMVDTGERFVGDEQLSTGTREQLWLALRMGMAKLLFPDMEIPLLFDDSFVFYDDRRLTETLKWLVGQNPAQVILFTCQRREMEILEKLGADYHLIFLSSGN